MTDMNALINLMKELDDQLAVCMRCGMCQSVCPLYAQTGREADVARGKLALLDGLNRKLFEDPEGVSDRLNKCLLCGSCAANCPSGVDVMRIFLKARALLAGYMGLSPAKKLILRGVVSRPEIFHQVMEMGARFQKLFVRPANETVGTSCARFMSPLIGDRHFLPLAPKPFHRMIPSMDTAPDASGVRVAFFVGCIIDKIFPRVAQAALKALDHHGVGVYMPANQACCGIPALSSGDMDAYATLLRHNLDQFDPDRFDYLITACATCTSTIKEIWPKMAGDVPAGEGYDPVERVKAVSEKTMDINRFLVSVLRVAPGDAGPADDATAVTYHDPCHLKKSMGVFAEPRTLLKTNPDYRFVEMAESDWCCGMGGSFNLQHYDLSSDIGKRKRENIINTGCAVLATGCPACMLQISDALSRSGDRIAVKHPVEIYAERL